MTNRDKWLDKQRELWDARAELRDLRPVMDPEDENGTKNRYLTALHLSHLMWHLKSRIETTIEIGCGIGRIVEMLLPKSKRVIGIDFSSEMISVAHRRLSKAQFLIGYGSQLPLQDNIADLIVSIWVLQHVIVEKTLCEILNECYRVARYGSLFFIIEQVSFDSSLRSKEGYNYHVRRQPCEYKRAFSNAGWKTLHSYPIRSHPCLGLRHPIFMRLLENQRASWITSYSESIWARMQQTKSQYIDWCFVCRKK